MFVIYDLIYLVLVIIYLPMYLFYRKFHPGFSRRFGILPKGLSFDRPIWIHAVSVGEAMVARGLVEQLRQEYPHKQFVISTVTATGNKIASPMVTDRDFLTYLPFDFSFITSSIMRRIDPSVFIIVETEIWPNLIRALHKKNIPVITVNGRLSDASFKGYSMARFLVKPVLDKITLFCVQTEIDFYRFVSLGVPENKIKIVGNMKFDSKDSLSAGKESASYRKKLGLKDEEILIVAGSTHPGEEVLLLEAYRKLLLTRAGGGARLLLAPRHPERAEEVEALVKESGFSPQRIARLGDKENSDAQAIFILDTIGSLIYFYSAADIVFVGGSLIKKGGHNILEPASLGKPIVFGPHMFNFRDIAALFLEHKAALMVQDQQDLETELERLMHDTGGAAALVDKARELFKENQGATQKTVAFIKEIIV